MVMFSKLCSNMCLCDGGGVDSKSISFFFPFWFICDDKWILHLPVVSIVHSSIHLYAFSRPPIDVLVPHMQRIFVASRCLDGTKAHETNWTGPSAAPSIQLIHFIHFHMPPHIIHMYHHQCRERVWLETEIIVSVICTRSRLTHENSTNSCSVLFREVVVVTWSLYEFQFYWRRTLCNRQSRQCIPNPFWRRSFYVAQHWPGTELHSL